MGKKDINWVNALKALCIIFVFLRHCGNYYGAGLGWFDRIYLPFYVNAFFFVSGYLLFWKQLSAPKINEMRKEYVTGGGITLALNVLYRIVIPSILFSTIEFFPKKLIKGDEIIVSDCLFETLGGCTYWFTSALVVAELLFLLLLFTRFRNIWFYVFAALILTSIGKHVIDSGFTFIEGHGSFPWQWKHGLICTIYMAAGGVYWRFEALVRKVMKGWVTLLLLVAFCFCSIYFFDYLYSGYMVSMLLIHPIGVLWGVLASVLLIEFCRHLPENHILTFIGQNSIGFYFLSGALPMTFGIIYKKLPFEPNVGVHLSIWIMTLSIAYFVVAGINRFAPWIWDMRRLKNRNCKM